MSFGYFKVSLDEKTGLDISPNVPEGDSIPDDQLNLMLEILSASSVIDQLYLEDTSDHKNAYDLLFKLASTGLENEFAQPVLASKALIQFKKDIVDKESGKKKNQYIKKLGGIASLLGSVPLMIGIYVHYLVSHNCISFDFIEIANFLILWSGTMVGVWLSFAITRKYIAFDDLAIIEKDRLEPALRLIFTGVLSIIIALLFLMNVLHISIGGLSSHNITNDPVTAFLIGTLLGINEKIIGSTLLKKASSIFSS
jgi:hypothetical protein